MSPETRADLQNRARDLPDRPGVYVMKDESGRVLYVGKASSLRSRVRSYFQSPQGLARRTRSLVECISDFECMVTDSEVEALILENNLIKRHRPRFNVRLRDDKTYPFIKITTAETFPRAIVTRRVEQDGSRYFGPYADVKGMRETLRFLRDLFPVRTCSKRIDEGSRERPCLNYQIEKCLAPCAGRITREAYMEVIRQISLFLEGRQEMLVREMRRRMEAASRSLDFEAAAALRDRIRAMERVIERQKIVLRSGRDIDIIGFWRDGARDGAETCVEVFFVRGGKLIGRERFFMVSMVGAADTPDTEMLAAFLKQYYSDASFVPREVVVQVDLEERDAIEAWLANKRGGKVEVIAPLRGEKKRLVDMVRDNARLGLEEARARVMRDAEMEGGALVDLQQALGLSGPPQRIEAFDISTIQGADAVGSLVVFERGRPAKSAYRRFKIRTVQGQDDFAMMREVVARRCRRALERPDSRFGGLPDLVLIDGGKGQLGAAIEALRESGLGHIPAAGLAKEHELLYVEGRKDPVALPRDSRALLLLQRVRDEAHRFAVSYHRQLRTKRATLSMLEEVPGVGRKRLKALLAAFRSVRAMREATIDDLARVPGMTRKVAELVKRALDSPSQGTVP